MLGSYDKVLYAMDELWSIGCNIKLWNMEKIYRDSMKIALCAEKVTGEEREL